MAVVAAPDYLGNNFKDASPGLRFGHYLQVWTSRKDQEKQIHDRANKKSREASIIKEHLKAHGMDATIAKWESIGKNSLPKCWEKDRVASNAAWKLTAELNASDQALLASLVERQRALGNQYIDTMSMAIFDARSISPFTTGLGNEHPLENGFAFLNPYGLPYLPGSGVKGVVRQAARELESGDWGNNHGWTKEAIVALFGTEDSIEAKRGALMFWDVIPIPEGSTLDVEVITGHQSHYYMDNGTPHESGQPIPINFLTIPPGSRFSFYIQCDMSLLELFPMLADGEKWSILLHVAFEHAFTWLGFGAKTAVGYGAMERDSNAEQNRVEEKRKSDERMKEADRLANMSPLDREMEELFSSKRNEAPGIVLFNAVNIDNRWSNPEERAIVAARIRGEWEKEGRWKPNFSGSNKKKIQQSEKCKKVLAWLERQENLK